MKIAFRSLLFAFFFLFILSANVYAEEFVPITGTAYGKKIGLLHFDYTTAIRPTGTTDDSRFDDPSFYIGPTRQFYIPFYDADYIGPDDMDVSARISTDACDATSCLLRGFIWSDTIGWIALNGTLINTAISDAIGLDPADEDDPAQDPYLTSMYPRIRTEGATAGAITGYGWNAYTGWIKFSADDQFGTTTQAEDQRFNIDGWGIWLDIDTNNNEIHDFGTPGSESPETDDDVLIGRRFHGYAWSENMGWLKFSKEPTDVFPFDFSGYTIWIPDDSAPPVLAPELVWFAVGKNTGYNPPEIGATTIYWEKFVYDPESAININPAVSMLFINPFEADPGCYKPGTGGITISRNLGDSFSADVTISTIGNVNAPTKGFCKYKLEGVISNGINLETYLGDKCLVDNPGDRDGYLPCGPLPEDPPDTAQLSDPIIVYVRAGDYDPTQSSISLKSKQITGISDNQAIADGRDFVKYYIEPKDVANNPIVPIDCSSGDEVSNPQFEYSIANWPAEVSGDPRDCPGKQVAITADIANDMLYDLTKPLSSQWILYENENQYKYATPVKLADFDVEGSGTHMRLTADPNGNPIPHPNPNNIYMDDSLEAYLGLIEFPIGGNSYHTWREKIQKDPVSTAHTIELASFAPSSTFDLILGDQLKTLLVNSINYLIQNDELPPTNLMEDPAQAGQDPPVLIPWPESIVIAYNQPGDPNPTGLNPGDMGADLGFVPATDGDITFAPPVKPLPGTLTAGGLEGVMSISVPTTVTYNLENISWRELNNLAIDNVFDYYTYPPNPSVALMETHRISGPSEDDGLPDKLAWTDPFNIFTRYELYDGEYYGGVSLEAENSIFRFEDLFYFELDLITPNFIPYYDIPGGDWWTTYNVPAYDLPVRDPLLSIRADGTYVLTGREGIPQDFAYLGPTHPITGEEEAPEDPFNYEPGEIDRSDKTDLSLPRTNDPNDPSNAPGTLTQDIDITFIPEKLVPVTIEDITFRLYQAIAYRFNDQIPFTVFMTQPNIDNVDVMDLGVEAVGTVAAETIATERRFDIVGTEGVRQLQDQIRRNVAELTSGLSESDIANCTISGTVTLEKDDFDIVALQANLCVIYDDVNNTLFAYYEGGVDDELVLGNGTDDIYLPNMPLTLTVKGGANVFIKSNIIYDEVTAPNASFGMIVIAENIGQGADVYISPRPTNIMATLYAEGSIISRLSTSALPIDPNDLYYGAGQAASSEPLSNQLYWKGSLASRNTIAGAGQEKVPEGIECLPGDTKLECAQRYDFDYLRRFNGFTDGAEEKSFIANSGQFPPGSGNYFGLFSGGGCCGEKPGCDLNAGECQLGLLPTTVVLKASPLAGINQIFDEVNSELSPLFVEPDPRTTNNPPPGFVVAGGLTTIQEIR